MGIFVRDQLGQQVGQPSAGWSDSPDIILNGQAIQPDLSTFTSDKGYATQSLNKVITGGLVDNYVYLRGLDTDNTSQNSHMFFYYTESDLMLFPKNWRSDHISVNGTNQNWSTLGAKSTNKVTVTTTPFIWNPPNLGGSQGDHYCTISWADNSPGIPTPPDLDKFSQFSSCEELAVFVQQHTNMGWRDTCDSPSNVDSHPFPSPITIPAGGAEINISIIFQGYPLDGTFNVNLQGTDPSNSISQNGLKLSNYQGGFNVSSLIFPPASTDYKVFLEMVWFKGTTPVPRGANVIVSITRETTLALVKMMNNAGIATSDIRVQMFYPTYFMPNQNPSSFKPTPVVLLGRQTWTVMPQPGSTFEFWQCESSRR